MALHRVEFYLPFGAVCAELDGEFAEMKKWKSMQKTCILYANVNRRCER